MTDMDHFLKYAVSVVKWYLKTQRRAEAKGKLKALIGINRLRNFIICWLHTFPIWDKIKASQLGGVCSM